MQRRRGLLPSNDRRHSSTIVNDKPKDLSVPRQQRRGVRLSAAKALVSLLIICVSLIGLLRRWQGANSDSDLAVFDQCRGEETTATKDTLALLANLSAPCTYFRPLPYFFHSSQPGYKYEQLIENAATNLKLSMWGKQVSTSHLFPSSPNEFLARQGIASVGAIMMPKVGSRAVDSLFLERLSSDNKHIKPGLTRAEAATHGSIPRVGIATPQFWNEMAEQHQAQQQGRNSKKTTQHLLFALVRNPISRFLSSLAQTLSEPMQRRCQACSLVLQPCVHQSQSYPELVKCVIGRMQHHEGFFDVHVVPQAVFLAGSLRGSDVEIAVFSMDHGGMSALLHAFGADPLQHKKNARDENEYSEFVMERFGDKLLSSSKARSSLDASIIRDICELYAMDVQMLMHLGFNVAECSSLSN